jgi:two-component system response regulator NreC
VLRECLSMVVSAQSDMEVVGQAADGLVAVSMAELLQPDVVVMDITMPNLSGVEATWILKKTCPRTRVLALTGHESPVLLNQMRKAGSVGYVLKHSPVSVLLLAIRQAAKGGVYFDAGLMVQAMSEYLTGRCQEQSGFVTALSIREAQVLYFLARGHTATDVANRMKISVKTVETYKARLMVKLGLTSRVELMNYAREHGLAE